MAVCVDPPHPAWEADATWTVTLHDSTDVLQSAYAAPPSVRDPVCPKDPSPYGEFTLAVGDECCTWRPGFECTGGDLSVWQGTQKTSLGGITGGPLVRRANDVLALEFCGHGYGSWAVESLSKINGSWSRRLVAGGDSHAVAFAVRGSWVDILVLDGGLHCAIPPKRSGVDPRWMFGDANTFVLLRVADDGAVKVLE